jgi:hypothetical protein
LPENGQSSPAAPGEKLTGKDRDGQDKEKAVNNSRSKEMNCSSSIAFIFHPAFCFHLVHPVNSCFRVSSKVELPPAYMAGGSAPFLRPVLN